jgi:hypothetical protein
VPRFIASLETLELIAIQTHKPTEFFLDKATEDLAAEN